MNAHPAHLIPIKQAAAKQPHSAQLKSLAVSTAAGPARHYRVQYRAAQDTNWQRYASFERSDQAHLCVRRLHNDGYAARLVQFSIAPAAG